MMVNLSVIRYHFFGSRQDRSPKIAPNLIFPLLGFIVSTSIWMSISRMAFKLGFLWSALGLIYLAYLTRGFRRVLREADSGLQQQAAAMTGPSETIY
jgi:hypothetical protein